MKVIQIRFHLNKIASYISQVKMKHLSGFDEKVAY